METVARRIVQIVEVYSGEGGTPRWARVRHYEGRTSAMDCIDPKENLRGKFTGVTGAGRQGGATTSTGDGADEKEHLPPTKTARSRAGGSDALTLNQASGIGTTIGRIKSLEGGCGVVLDSLFPLPSRFMNWGRVRRGGNRCPRLGDIAGQGVGRSVPTFAIPASGFSEAAARPWYDMCDGGLSLASFRSVSKISLSGDHCGISPRRHVNTSKMAWSAC